MIADWQLAAVPSVALMEACEIRVPGSALRPPAITYLVRERLWRVERDYTYDGGDWHISIAEGFLFDLASIPRPAWWLCAPFELSIAAPLIHDALYRYAGRAGPLVDTCRVWSRQDSDLIFRRVAREEGVAQWRRGPAYGVVRGLGVNAWGNSKLPGVRV